MGFVQTCIQCGVNRDVKDFPLKGRGNQERRLRCRICECSSTKKQKAQVKAQRTPEEHSRYMKNVYLKSKFGLTIEQYDEMVSSQNNLCAICEQSPKLGKVLVVDHNHKTNTVRALLCSHCNTVLGLFYENIQLLNEAIAYLQFDNSTVEAILLGAYNFGPRVNNKDQCLRQNYGITLEMYEALCEVQQNACAICGQVSGRSLHVDHNHCNNKIRGLLCDTCNRGLGYARDDIQILEKAIEYLETYNQE